MLQLQTLISIVDFNCHSIVSRPLFLDNRQPDFVLARSPTSIIFVWRLAAGGNIISDGDDDPRLVLLPVTVANTYVLLKIGANQVEKGVLKMSNDKMFP